MTVAVEPAAIRLSGRCLAEDAEPLLGALQDHPDLPIAIDGVQKLHLAVMQLLLAARRPVSGVPESAVLARHLANLFP